MERRDRPRADISPALMRLATAVAFAVCAVAIMQVTHGRSEPLKRGSGSFVTRQGTRLFLEGSPFRFTGYNNYVMTGCGDPEEELNDAQRDRFFAALRPRSVVRVWAFPNMSVDAIDRVIASARKSDQRLVLTLTDANGSCGDTEKDRRWFTGGYKEIYFPWLRTIVPRYADSPTLAMWELINEPIDGPGVASLRLFFDDAGRLVRELDRNHLISSGTLLPEEYGGEGNFRRLADSPGIDVISMHEYDQLPSMAGQAGQAIAAAQAARKPLLIGEWGVIANEVGISDTRTSNGGTCQTLVGRADMARAKLQDYFAHQEVAGALYWAYSMNHHTDCSLGTFDGDPLMIVIYELPLR